MVALVIVLRYNNYSLVYYYNILHVSLFALNQISETVGAVSNKALGDNDAFSLLFKIDYCNAYFTDTIWMNFNKS